MKLAGSTCGSCPSRTKRRGAAMWAQSCILACLCACSGSTDVVGVFDDSAVQTQQQSSDTSATSPQDVSVSGAGADTASGDAQQQLLVVAGLPLRDYQGPSFDWPLGMPLHAFFAESTWQHSGPPANVERYAFARMGGNLPEQRHDDVRFVASTGSNAARLIDVFEEATAFFGSEPRSLVLRDAWGDEYLVVLGTTTTDCVMAEGHHSGSCAEPNSYSDDPSFEAP